MVTYIRSDLDFILQQIELAEAHAAGQPLYGPGGLIPSYNLSWGLRTVDGTYNNLLPGRSEDGASDNPFPTLLGTNYRTIMVDPDGPGGMGPMPVSYQPGVDNDGPFGPADPGDVYDPYVRTISNLIVDQTLGNPAAILTGLQRGGVVAPENEMTVLGTITAAYEAIEAEFLAVSQSQVAYFNLATTAAANPADGAAQAAAAAALIVLNDAVTALNAVRGPLDALLDANGIVLEGDNIQITNVAPDEGLSAPFNSWFTLFGQFFDHGLDLVAKGGAGTVFIPLAADDPLYVEGSDTNFMVLTRATLGPDGPINTTTSFVDQNQTYASHASHQVFLREYELNGAGDPVNTGRLIEGSNNGMATWADMKMQASDMLGIWLRDVDVGNIPLLATDEYGNFIPGANGFPQVVFPGANPGDPPVLVEGNPAANGGLGISIVGAIATGHAFLADIAHTAVPGGLEDGDIEIGLDNGGLSTDGTYDNELLDAHFMAGDGRANENIGLTAVHHVFHSEHNRLVEHTKDVVIADANAMLADGASQAEAVDFLNKWLIDDVATVPASPAGLIWDGERLFQAAKFGTEMQYQHLVFEEFARKIQPTINTFLVPDGYDVTIDPSIVAEFAHVVYRFGHSMLTETIDRFDPSMTEDQISLIEGFLNPLQFQNNGGIATVDADIAAGAIIRGMTRQAGNEIDEFVTSALRNNLLGLPLDLATINLARGRDTGVPSLNEARREFYEASNQNALLKPYESWVDYASHLKNEASIINFIAAYGDHALITGQDTIDGKRDAALTIITGSSVGGLDVPADRLDFLNATGAYAGGTLGGLESIDLWIGGLAEETMPFGGMLGSTFNFVFEVQMEQLQSGDRFYYLQRLDGLHLFGEMEGNSFAAMIMRNTDAGHLPSDVFSTPGLILEVNQAAQFNDLNGDGILESADPLGSGILTQLVSRNNPNTVGVDSNYLRYTGGDHIVLGGTNADDVIIAGIGDDTLYGDQGADRIDGGFGNDIINGGEGDDIIVDTGGDDNIKAQDGNDVVHAGPGLDLVMGGRGQDFIVLGNDEGSEVFAGEGNDFILGNRNAERVLGNEGNDWIETGTFDGAPGDNFDEIFAHDGIDGHDVFIGDGGFDEFIGEGGDDIMVGSPGRGKMVGMSGFDWATYKDNITGVNADLSIPIVFDEAPVLPGDAALEEFEGMEGLSGSAHDDILRGNNEGAIGMAPTSAGGSGGYQGSVLDEEGIAMIAGLEALLRGATSHSAGDIILGGAGSDQIEGQGGDDIIDGDSWLNVRIAVHEDIGPDGGTGAVLEHVNSMTQLMARMFSGEINPGQLRIARSIETEDGVGDTDVAVYSDVRSSYDIANNGDGSYTVTHARGTQTDGTDILWNVEALRFSNGVGGTTDFAIDDLGSVLALSDIFTTGETGILNGNVLNDNGGGADATIPAGGPLTVSAVNGSAAAVGVATVLASGATVTLNANGTFSYNPGTAFRALGGPASGASNTVGTDSFTYTLAGGSTATVNLTINGQDTTFDVLQGTAGADSLYGGIGNDTVNGLGGLDTANYAAAAAGVFVNLNSQTTTNDGDGGVDTLSSIENATGSAFNDTLIGNAVSNTLTGGTGGDTLIGLAGNDILIGGSGATNQMQGGQGDDLYVVSVNDTIVEFAGEGTDTIATTLNTFVQKNEVEHLTFTGAGDFAGTGNALANTMTGGVGNDTLAGRGGNDLLNGGLGSDTASYTAAAAAVFVNLNSQMATNDGDGGVDTLSSIENATGSGFNDTLLGNAGVNTLTGGAGGDTLIGLAGNDILIGGAGAPNQMQGGLNDDLYIVSANDTIVEFAGEGIDTIATSLNVFVQRNNVEHLTFTGAGDFTATGNALANTITGAGGNDVLAGGGGSDLLIGGAGNDQAQLQGLAGQYTVMAIAGGYQITDNIAGRDGVDTVMGVEQVRYANGTVASLAALAAAPAPVLTAKSAAAQVLPAEQESKDAGPQVLPGTSDKLDDGSVPLVLPGHEAGQMSFKDSGPLVLPGSGGKSEVVAPLVNPGQEPELMDFKDVAPLVLPPVFDTGEMMKRLMEEDPFVLPQEFDPTGEDMFGPQVLPGELMDNVFDREFLGLHAKLGFSDHVSSDETGFGGAPGDSWLLARGLDDWFG